MERSKLTTTAVKWLFNIQWNFQDVPYKIALTSLWSTTCHFVVYRPSFLPNQITFQRLDVHRIWEYTFFLQIQYYLLILKVCRTTLGICFETVVQLSQQLTRSCRNQYCATHGYLLDSSGNHMPKNSKDSELDTEKDIDFKNDKAVIKKASID